jgi:hypothetical protein
MISQSHEEEQSAGAERSNASVASNKRSLEEMQAGQIMLSTGTPQGPPAGMLPNQPSVPIDCPVVTSAAPVVKEELGQLDVKASEAMMGLFMLRR